jgi:hypothetical protein
MKMALLKVVGHKSFCSKFATSPCPKLCPVAAFTGLGASGDEVQKSAFLLVNPNVSKLR